MNFKEKLDRLDGVYAYDGGCVSSGIKDDSFKASLIDDPDKEKLLTELCKQYLNSEQGYTFEDITSLVKWAEDNDFGY
jgi:hypothetical protein